MGVSISISISIYFKSKESSLFKNRHVQTGIIGRTFENKLGKVMLKLYNSLVRSYLQYYRKNINKLERVQRRITKHDSKAEKINLMKIELRKIKLIQPRKTKELIINVQDHHIISQYFTFERSNITT